MVQEYRKLKIWKRSFNLAIKIYKISNKFPKSEEYNLTSQLKRASLSISTNIAEGSSKHTRRDFIRFLYNAYGSLRETQNLILFAIDMNYINDNSNEIITEINNLIGVYSDPKRDPRGHTITIVYELKIIKGEIESGDDALEANYFNINKLPANLSFDHKDIIKDYLRREY